jgi:hypothetical protein
LSIKKVREKLKANNYPGFQDGCLLLIKKRKKPKYTFVGVGYDKLYVYLGGGEILGYHWLGGVRVMPLERLLRRHISFKTATNTDLDLFHAKQIVKFVKKDILSAPLISRIFSHFYSSNELLIESILAFCVLALPRLTNLNWRINEPFNYRKYINKRQALTGIIYKRFT